MSTKDTAGTRTALLVIGWAWVGIPFAYGLYALIQKATLLFTG